MIHRVLLPISLCIAAFFTAIQTSAQDLTVGSYNIRNDNQGDRNNGDGWERRSPIMANQMLFNDFDFVGMQEVLHGQLEDLLALMPKYGFVGVGRDDGKTKGEYAPILYKTDRFKLLRSGNFWLSENTDYPNKGWDAALPRICSWGLFKDLKMNKKVWFFNLHFDHIGVEARRQSSRLVLKKITEMCGQDAVILTGDFNIDQTNEGYKLIANSNILFDTYELAEIRYELNGTFNGFKSNRLSNSRIDHIFVSKRLKASRYGILTDTYRTLPADKPQPSGMFSTEAEVRMISDHFPLKVTLYYQAVGKK